jgi:Mg-chelatase subunit ChlD
VRVEEFYNAFDYGDPVPSAKEPVSCFMEQAAHPLFASRNLVRVSMRTAAAGRSAGQPLHLTLLVDQSGSMVRADRSAVMNAAIAELTTLLGPQDQVSIVGFARTPRLIAEKILGNEGARIRQTLAEIPSDGGTNLEQAMALAQEISQRHMQPGAQNRILLMTDGAANLGNAKPEELAERVKSMRQSGLAFDIAGIGTDGLNDQLLLELARHGNGRYYVVNRLTDASDGFANQLAGAFRPAAENVKVQVHFNPERVSRYRLIGFEKDRLKTEDFRNDAVDAAELAAAEAGQAIYQVELLPEGRGDIGEVSVRFRDTVSAQMVERKWTIAHQPSAPAWDRASPSMQLAGLAMFAGEKLKGGAVGEMVTFQDWQALRANVQQYYRQNPRVAQLMDMIRQIEP